MSFTSLYYLLFLLFVTGLYYIFPQKVKPVFLLAASYLFYGMNNWKAVPFLIIFTLAVYVFGLVFGKKNKKLTLLLAVLCVLFPLLLCKYFDFGFSLLDRMLLFVHREPSNIRLNLIQPLGISYFTFKSISYLVDVYKGKCEAEKNFVHLAVFVSFFPEMLIGPIDYASNLLPQIKSASSKDAWDHMVSGMLMLFGGYFEKMVVADRLGIIVNEVIGNLYHYEGMTVLIAACCYSLQIYLDFAGCTYMALGTGKMLGFKLPENFRQPYFAVSVEDFWRRWHMSLTSWLRNYIYIPLGGNRKGKIRKYINVMVVFLVSGIWHGAGTNFVIWGLLNGLFQITGTLLRGVKSRGYHLLGIKEDTFLCKCWKRMGTFFWMTIAWVFFRAGNLSEALLVFKKIFAAWNPWVLFDGTMYTLGLSQKNLYFLIIMLLIILFVDYLHEKEFSIVQWFKGQHFIAKCLMSYVLIFMIIIFGIYGSAYNAASFIYMQF